MAIIQDAPFEQCFGGPGKGEKDLFERFLKRRSKLPCRMAAPGAPKTAEQEIVWSTCRCAWLYEATEMAVFGGFHSTQYPDATHQSIRESEAS